MKEKMKVLISKLNEASEAYYAGEAFMTDRRWDELYDELMDLEEKSGIRLPDSPTFAPGATVVSELESAKHEHPALSLDKVKYANKESLIKWLGSNQGVVSWKCDGSTVVATYDNGKLTSAVTRGNGEVGSVITHNARHFRGLPEMIRYKGHLVVRGEAMMAYEEFERVNAEAGGVYENPRNLATATIQMLDSEESRQREIIFKAFELVSPAPDSGYHIGAGAVVLKPEDEGYLDSSNLDLRFMGDRLTWLQRLWFDVVDYEYVDTTDILSKVEEWKDDVKNLKFPTDGLVISYNDMEYGMSLGSTGHHFRHSIALKWTDETKETIIRDIEWSVGKTGVITPVAVFDPVRLGAGSNVTRASLHNLSVMHDMPDIDGGEGRCPCVEGSRARVYLANMIIPQIAASSKPSYESGLKKATKYLEGIATSEFYDIVEDSYDYENGLMLIEYDSEEAKRGLKPGEIGHTCVNVDEFAGSDYPRTCPVCGSETRLDDSNGVFTLHCDNKDCAARQIGRLMNSFSKSGLYVKGLGESQIEDLMQAGLVDDTPYSFYDLATHWKEFNANPGRNYSEPGYIAYKELMKKDGWGEKKWENLINAVDASRETTLQKFLYSLNVPLLGNDLSKKLSKFFHDDIESFIVFVNRVDEAAGDNKVYGYQRAVDTLMSIDGIGEEKARNVVRWAWELRRNPENYMDFLRLIDELKFPKATEVSTADNSLEGLTFVITGKVFQYKNRDEFKASVEARGGKVAGSVSKKTTLLVNNDINSTTGKNAKAKELGIEVISEDEFIRRYGK